MTETFIPPEGFELDDLFSGHERPETRATEKQRARRRREGHFIPFADLPRRQRRARVVSLGWRIRTDPNGLGVFTSHDILPGSREWPEGEGEQLSHWADVYFLEQRRQPTLYFNATVQTVARTWAQRVLVMAEEAVNAQLTPEDKQLARPMAFSKWGRHGVEMVFAPPRRLASLDGLSTDGAKAAWLRAHWNQRGTLVVAGEEAVLDWGYLSGVGLDLITAEPTLSVAAITRAIAVFRERGEQAYVMAPEPFASHQGTVDALLLARLWQWDCMQAQAEGKEQPAFPEAAAAGDGFDTNAIRL